MGQRLLARAKLKGFDPSGPHTLRAAVDRVVITGTAIGFVGDTALLIATAYDRAGNVVTGLEVDWSSSQPTMISVIAGLCSFLIPGTATITATVDGRAYTATATSAAAMALTYDWAPVANPSEIAIPRISPSSGRTDGFTNTNIIPAGSTLYGNIRSAYPRSATTWAHTTFSEAIGDSTNPPQIRLCGSVTDGGTGPVDGSKVFDVPFLGGFESQSYAGYGITVPQPATDNEDVTTFKRGGYLGVRSRTSADDGKKVYIQLADITTDPANPAVWTTTTVTLSSSWQYPGVDLSADHFANLSVIVRPAYSDTPIATGVRLLANSLPIARNPAVDYEKLRLNAWHDSYGLLSQFQHKNAWPEANITLGGGASRVTSAADAPDAANYYSGHKLDTYTIPNGGYVTSSGLLGVTQANAAGNEAPTAIWLHHDAPNLASGSLQAYVTNSSPTTYGPVTMTRDAFGFHRARLPVNLFGEGEKQFIPKIQNNSGATLVFDATRFAMTCEEDRNQGRHNAIIPKRAITVAGTNEAVFNVIQDVTALVTRSEGLWGMRFLPIEDVDIMASTWTPDSPELWQSGPNGSDDYNFSAGIRNSIGHPGNAEIYVTMARGAGFESYASWGGSFIVAPGQLPKMVPFDLFVAWQNSAIVALGIGGGVGTDITWLTNGQIYNGFAVSISAIAGTAWNLTDAGSIASGARHIGMGADRDHTRQFGGFIQGLYAAKTVTPSTVRGSVAAQVVRRLGARA